MDAAPRPALPSERAAETALLVVLAVLLAAAIFAGGGSTDDALAKVGIASVIAAATALGAALSGALTLPRLDRAARTAVLACALLTAWAGLSIAWSIAGDLSWQWLARGLVYVAFVVLGLLAGAAARGVRGVAAVAALVLALALGWALLGVAVPSLFPDGDRIARLREPVGYWNALALLAGAALALGLWLARGPRSARRAAGSLLVYAAVVALFLTQSRAGVLGAAGALVLWLVLSDERLADAVRAALAALPALLVVGWAFTRAALVEDGALRADRVDDGRVFALVLSVGAVVVVAAAWWAPVTHLVARHRRTVTVVVTGACAAVVLAGAAGLVAKVGNPWDWASSQVSGGECVNDPGRFTELCANNRVDWWREAARIGADNPVAGTGAGTFAIARKRHREDATPVSEPHSVPLQLLADLGAVGLVLGLVAAAAAAVGIRRSLQRVPPEERGAAGALACVALVYGLHALVDYDLDFLAVTAPALTAVGALFGAAQPPSPARAGVPGLVALAAVAVAAAVAIALPALAERDVDRALAAVDEGRISDAVDTADRARLLNPLSLGPLRARALAADADGDRAAAVAWYEEATELQPENPDTWYELGLYHAIATGDQCAAYQALNHAYTLDPRSSRWAAGGPLDAARDAVNAGACE